jgi:hypothetical protein
VHVIGAALSSAIHRQTVEDAARGVTVEIGGIPIFLQSDDPDFLRILKARYAGFLNTGAEPACTFEIDLQSHAPFPNEDATVSRRGHVWVLERGDFFSEWDARSRCGWIRQSPNPYSIDTLLRLVHSLVLAEEGGFLLHAASAVRRGRAFLFSGISGAGKTTISRLAPPDADVLTDEISYVRRGALGYRAYGTPFAGELARVGANLSAPLATLYFLEKGPSNRIEPIGRMAAARALLRNILFFAHDDKLVKRVFDSALEFVSHVDVARLVFAPDERVWALIG